MFPGYDGGETTQRIAAALLELTTPARWRIDIHCSNVDFEELPQVRLYDPDRRGARGGALARPARPSSSGPLTPTYQATLANAWRERGGGALVIQAGYAGSMQPQHCERLFRALVDFLERAGLLLGVRLAEPEEDVHHFGPRHSFPIISEHAGWFVSRLEVGQWLQAGELRRLRLRRLHRRPALRGPHARLGPALRHPPPAAALRRRSASRASCSTQEVGEVADTYLMGHGQ